MVKTIILRGICHVTMLPWVSCWVMYSHQTHQRHRRQHQNDTHKRRYFKAEVLEQQLKTEEEKNKRYTVLERVIPFEKLSDRIKQRGKTETCHSRRCPTDNLVSCIDCFNLSDGHVSLHHEVC